MHAKSKKRTVIQNNCNGHTGRQGSSKHWLWSAKENVTNWAKLI